MIEVKIPEVRICRADSYSIFRALLGEDDTPVDVTLFSFAVAEVWIRRFISLKAAGKIRRLRVCANFEIMSRQMTSCLMLDEVCDAFYLTNTHAKMIYVEEVPGGGGKGGGDVGKPHGKLPHRGVFHDGRPGGLQENQGGYRACTRWLR